MSPSRRRGRRVPPRARGTGPAMPPGAFGAGDAPAPLPARASDPAAVPGGGPVAEPIAGPVAEPVRPISRSSNRAAKRAASGRPPAGTPRPQKRPSSTGPLLALGVVAAAVVVGVIAFGNPFGGGGGGGSSPGTSPTPAATRALTGCPTAAPAGLAAGEKRTVTLATTEGDIVIEVSADLAPVAAANFVALAACGFYDGVIFHRVIPDFMIQGGDGQYAWIGGLVAGRAGQGDAGYEFDDEPVNGSYTRGTVAMANSGADTNGSQFFIMVKDSTTLPKDYVIFGQVTAGMEVADQIVSAPRNSDDYPDDPVSITTATVAPLASPSPSAAAGSPAASPAASAASPAATQ